MCKTLHNKTVSSVKMKLFMSIYCQNHKISFIYHNFNIDEHNLYDFYNNSIK